MRRLLAKGRQRGWSLVRLARVWGVSLRTLCPWRRRLEGSEGARFVELVTKSPAEQA
jgi:steroid 5-alpha reductase family enzyme